MKERTNHFSTQENVLNYCKNYIKRHGYAPSFKEIGDGVGLKSKSSVNHYMKKLIEDGSIATEHPKCPRAFRIVE